MSDVPAPGPLEGLKVLELAGLGASPYACMLLADLGADVLRIERASSFSGGPWETVNRGRHSVGLNLKTRAGRDLVLDLCEAADVLIEGFRPGVCERLGVGPDDCWTRNSKLIYARMTGYGQAGAMSLRAGHDINYIAMSGALWPIGRAGERPVIPLNLVGDFGGGALFLVVGVLAALHDVARSGVGQIVDAAMIDGSASLTTMLHSFLNAGLWHETRGENLLDSGAPFYDVYVTRDDQYVAVGAIEPQFYSELLQGLGLAESDLPPQYERARWPELRERFASLFATRTREEWVRRFEGTDACVTPVLSPREAARHPINVERQVFRFDERDAWPEPAPRFSRTPGRAGRMPTAPGAGTEVGLRSWGISTERIDSLRAEGALS